MLFLIPMRGCRDTNPLMVKSVDLEDSVTSPSRSVRGRKRDIPDFFPTPRKRKLRRPYSLLRVWTTREFSPNLVVCRTISSVFFVTILAAVKYFRRDFVDVRDLSVFVSHIRFSLCIVFSVFILGYYLFKRNYNVIVKSVIVFLIIWFLWQITIWESFISILIVTALCTILILYFILQYLFLFYLNYLVSKSIYCIYIVLLLIM